MKYRGALFDGFNSKRYVALPLSQKDLLRSPFLIWDQRLRKLHSESAYTLNSNRPTGSQIEIEGLGIYFPPALWNESYALLGDFFILFQGGMISGLPSREIKVGPGY